MENHPLVTGAVVCIQVFPELVETQIPPLTDPAASKVPSAEEAMEYQLFVVGALVCVQEVPVLVEVEIPP